MLPFTLKKLSPREQIAPEAIVTPFIILWSPHRGLFSFAHPPPKLLSLPHPSNAFFNTNPGNLSFN